MSELDSKMQKTIDSFKHQMISVRTNRANPDMLNDLKVDYYGAATPLNQLATISAPENMLLMVNVFDSNATKNVEKAIMTSNLNLNPQTEGSVIRIRLPELTEERRKELVKVIRGYAEESKIAIRNIRRDAIENIKKQEKEKEITEDDAKKEQQNIQKVTDNFVQKIDTLTQDKEKDILTI